VSVGGSTIGEVVVGPPVVGGLELDVSGEIRRRIPQTHFDP